MSQERRVGDATKGQSDGFQLSGGGLLEEQWDTDEELQLAFVRGSSAVKSMNRSELEVLANTGKMYTNRTSARLFSLVLAVEHDWNFRKTRDTRLHR